jgi:hypothetical protein
VGDAQFDTVLGTIDLGTLAGAKYVDYDSFTIAEMGGAREVAARLAITATILGVHLTAKASGKIEGVKVVSYQCI